MWSAPGFLALFAGVFVVDVAYSRSVLLCPCDLLGKVSQMQGASPSSTTPLRPCLADACGPYAGVREPEDTRVQARINADTLARDCARRGSTWEVYHCAFFSHRCAFFARYHTNSRISLLAAYL